MLFQKIRKYWLRILIATGVTVATLAVVSLILLDLAFDGPQLWDDHGGCVDGWSLDEIEPFAQFKLPTTAENFTVYSEQSLQDCFIYIRFEIPASESELSVFLASTYIDKLEWVDYPNPFSNLPYGLDWLIDTSHRYRTGHGRGQVYHEVVVTDDAAHHTIYLVIFM